MTNSDAVKFAVVGCGRIGKRHAQMIDKHPEAKLVALCDTAAKETLGLPDYEAPFFNSLEALLEASLEADVINIATPNALHAPQAIKALQSKCHVVVEKPLALTKGDAEKTIFTALQHNRHVFAVMQNRYSPPSVWLKDILESGKLGRINLVQINCFWNRDERYYQPGSWHGKKDLDGGTLFTQFSHFIDVMYWLFGDIENVEARLKDFNHQESTEFEDSGTVSFNFQAGGSGVLSFTTSCWDTNFESSITILAENGTIKVGGQYMNEVEYCHVKDYEMPELAPSNPANDYGPFKGSAANHVHLIENVVDVLKERDTITTNALEGMKIVDIIERIYQSAKSL
jgi:predicted dehydrogenase